MFKIRRDVCFFVLLLFNFAGFAGEDVAVGSPSWLTFSSDYKTV